MLRDCALDNGEAESGTVNGANIARTLEGFEQMRDVLCGNANSLIGDLQHKLALLPPDAEADDATLR